MSYRTTCPNCASVFRLGDDQLDAAEGWVQCGVCGAAFDARASLRLADGSPLPLPEPPAAETTVPPEPVAVAEPAPAADTLAAPEPAPELVPAAEPEPAVEPPRGIAEREASLDLDSIILIEPDIPVSDEPGALPPVYPVPSRYPPSPTSVSAVAPAAPPAVAPTETEAAASARIPPAADVEYAPALPEAAPRARIRPWLWAAASVLLAVVLAAQTLFFLRDTVVSRLPQTRPAFEQACAALGCTLSLPKNLALLQIIGSDLQTEASGRLKLTLTLGNRAGHAQAWPVLLLTLTDQRNRPLARRSFAPSEYLSDPARIAAGVPPRSEEALSLPLAVQGPAPMGFDLQLAY